MVPLFSIKIPHCLRWRQPQKNLDNFVLNLPSACAYIHNTTTFNDSLTLFDNVFGELFTTIILSVYYSIWTISFISLYIWYVVASGPLWVHQKALERSNWSALYAKGNRKLSKINNYSHDSLALNYKVTWKGMTFHIRERERDKGWSVCFRLKQIWCQGLCFGVSWGYGPSWKPLHICHPLIPIALNFSHDDNHGINVRLVGSVPCLSNLIFFPLIVIVYVSACVYLQDLQ